MQRSSARGSEQSGKSKSNQLIEGKPEHVAIEAASEIAEDITVRLDPSHLHFLPNTLK